MAHDLTEQLREVLGALEAGGIAYALCGGLAMAVYGRVRATVDVDLMVRKEQSDEAAAALARLGYTIEALPMHFREVGLAIRRVSRVDPETGELDTIDLLLPDPELQDVWHDRRRLAWEGGEIWVVSPAGLSRLKSLRGSGVDQDDIAWLEELETES